MSLLGSLKNRYQRPRLERTAQTSYSLARQLAKSGQLGEAKAKYQEALDILRTLSQDEPERHLPDLAKVCNSYGVLLTHAAEPERSAPLHREAMDIYSRLAESNAAHLLDLGDSQNNLANALSALGRVPEASDNYLKALGTYRRLEKSRPGAFTERIAHVQTNLGNLLANTGHAEEARESYFAAMETLLRLAEKDPRRHQANLAVTCNNLAALLTDMGQFDQALPLYRQCLELRRDMEAAEPGVYLVDLAQVQNNLGNLLAKMNQHDEAAKHLSDAMGTMRELARAEPGAYLAHYATACHNLGAVRADMGRTDLAERLYQRALDIRRRLAAGHPGQFAPEVAVSANYLGLLYHQQGRHAQAAPLLAEALQNYAWLYRQNSEMYRKNLYFVLKLVDELAVAPAFQDRLEWLAELWQGLLARYGGELVYITDELADTFRKAGADELALEARVFIKAVLHSMGHEEARQAAEELEALCAELGPWAAEAVPGLEQRLAPHIGTAPSMH